LLKKLEIILEYYFFAAPGSPIMFRPLQDYRVKVVTMIYFRVVFSVCPWWSWWKNEQVEPEVENSFRFKISRTSWEKKGFL